MLCTFNVELPSSKLASHLISNNIIDHIDCINNYHNCNINRSKYDLQIIIPTYNSSCYIASCLDSIISQKTNYKYQIIIVNDGSTDETVSILNKYKKIL